MKTIALPEDLHKELLRLKLDHGSKNVSDILRKMLNAYRRQRFLQASKMFNEMLRKSGKSFKQFLKDADKIKEEVVNEQFPDL